MKDKVLLDTDVVINILKKREETIFKLNSMVDYELFISPVVIAEIYAGARKNEKEQIAKLFSFFKSLIIDDAIGVKTGEYAKEFKKAYCGISLEDYMMAATAKQYNMQLWTYNKKHYPMSDIVYI